MSKGAHQGMKYESDFRQKVKALYLRHRSIAAVIRELKRQGHTPPSANTLRRWMEEENWRDALNLRDKLTEAEYDPDNDELDVLIKNQRAMLKIALGEIASKQPDGTIKITKADPQNLHAYNRLAETLGRLLGIKRQVEKEKSQETPIEVIFNALKAHPLFKRLLDNAEVRAQLIELMGREMLAYQKRAVSR